MEFAAAVYSCRSEGFCTDAVMQGELYEPIGNDGAEEHFFGSWCSFLPTQAYFCKLIFQKQNLNFSE